MMQYKNTKIKVHSSDGDTDYFDIAAGVLQKDTLATYLFIISLDHGLRTSIDILKDVFFKLAKEKNQKIHRPNYYRCGLRWWHSASGKYTHPSKNPGTLPEKSGC